MRRTSWSVSSRDRNREQRQRGSLERGVADLHDPLVRQVGDQADAARVVDVDVPRESAREVKYIEIGKIDAVILMEQM